MNKRGIRKQDRTVKSHRINRPLKNGCKSFTANTVWSFYRIPKLTSTFQETFNIRIIIFQSKKKENTWNHILCIVCVCVYHWTVVISNFYRISCFHARMGKAERMTLKSRFNPKNGNQRTNAIQFISIVCDVSALKIIVFHVLKRFFIYFFYISWTFFVT